MIRTFLDSGVLLTAWRGEDGETALALMEDPERQHYTSQLVKLELLSKAAYFKNNAEFKFYQTFFRAVRAEEPLSRALGEKALELAKRHGIAAMDALHVAAAIRLDVEEFITAEKPGKPVFRVSEISVKSIYSR